MRQDLDRLMRERGLAGMVVLAYDRYSPAMHYATGQKLHVAAYFRGADGRALLIHDPMERDQAAAVGCEHSGLPQHGWTQLVEAEGHPARAWGRLIAETCVTLGMTGPLAFFGEVPLAFADVLLQRMRQVEPRLTGDERHPDILTLARATKDDAEVRAIRRAAAGTVAALAALREYLGALEPVGEGFRHDGGPVTLGRLRQLLQREFLEHGLAEDAESIVSQGRDAGVPHNRGNDDDPVHAGAPVLVDIFPGEVGGGYHSDVTRTFCLGPAPEPLRQVYQDVHDAHRLAWSRLALGAPCRALQEVVCDLFEDRGHPTRRTDHAAQEGYVHSLGHGVGLSVHEDPLLGGPATNTAVLEPHMVITLEPGLYYPSRGLGVRIEDLVLARPDGTFENLTPASYELEIPIKR